MANKSESLDEINLGDISNEIIQKKLLEVAKKHLNSTNVKFYTKHGSKKGMNHRNGSIRMFKQIENEDI